MHCLFTDETNSEESTKNKFFVYGGILFDMARYRELDEGIQAIRTTAGYEPGDILKFDTNFRPQHVSIEAATEAKKLVVQLCLKCGCRFISLIILHKIIDKSNKDNKFLWAADHVIGRFNRYLSEEVNDVGIVFIDTLPVNSQWKYLSEKFIKGLHRRDDTWVSLDQIRCYSATCMNASNMASVIDIVLGSFRYCVNEPKNMEAASEMMKQVVSMMWHHKVGDTIHLAGRGLMLRPKEIKVAQYKQEYDNLVSHFNLLLK